LVRITEGVSECTGFRNTTDADPLILSGLDVQNWCSSSSDNGLLLNGTSATISNVTVSAKHVALGLHNPSTSFKYVNIHEAELEAAVAGYGIWCQVEGSSGLGVSLRRSQVRTAGTAVYNHLDQCSVHIGASQIAGGVLGAATCAAVYDGSYSFFASTCPVP
jgi:hypothetical protein